MEIRAEEKKLTPTEQRMATENVRSLVWKYSIPTIISMFVNALYNVVDRFWVGKIPGVGKDALAGVGLTMPIITIGLGVAMLIGIGAAATISISLGQRNKDRAEKILGNSITMGVILSIAFTAIGLLCKVPLLKLIGASETTLPFADDYITIVLYGYILQLFSFALNHPIRAAGNAKRFAATQLLGAIANMILDPILVLALGMGVKGAAIATVISMSLSVAYTLQFYFFGKSLLKIHKRNLPLNKDILISIMSIGFSPCFMQVAASVVALVINRGLKYYGDIELGNGDTAISAITIVNGIAMLALMPLFGINQGMQPIIGFNYGAGNYKRVRETYFWGVIYCIIISFIAFISIEIFAPNIIASFNDNQDLVKIGTRAMRVLISTTVFVGFQVPTVNFFTAIGRAKISMFLSLLRQVILLIPLFLILPMFFGLNGMWLAYPIADIAAAVITAIFIVKEFKLLKINMPAQTEQGAY